MSEIVVNRGILSKVVALVSSMLLVLTISGSPALANGTGWAHANCNDGWGSDATGDPIPNWARSDAKSYATGALHEGYQWGGGCWNLDDSDPKNWDPTRDTETHGEGPDCSGFTFKSWALKYNGNPGFVKWERKDYQHGPYPTGSYANPETDWQFKMFKNKNNRKEMDAFVLSGVHIGFVYNLGTTQGQDTILEAKCEACGVIRGPQNYRGDPNWLGVKREGWSSERNTCYGDCF